MPRSTRPKPPERTESSGATSRHRVCGGSPSCPPFGKRSAVPSARSSPGCGGGLGGRSRRAVRSWDDGARAGSPSVRPRARGAGGECDPFGLPVAAGVRRRSAAAAERASPGVRRGPARGDAAGARSARAARASSRRRAQARGRGATSRNPCSGFVADAGRGSDRRDVRRCRGTAAASSAAPTAASASAATSASAPGSATTAASASSAASARPAGVRGSDAASGTAPAAGAEAPEEAEGRRPAERGQRREARLGLRRQARPPRWPVRQRPPQGLSLLAVRRRASCRG